MKLSDSHPKDQLLFWLVSSFLWGFLVMLFCGLRDFGFFKSTAAMIVSGVAELLIVGFWLFILKKLQDIVEIVGTPFWNKILKFYRALAVFILLILRIALGFTIPFRLFR